MSFKKKKSFFKFLDNHFKNPEIQSYYDLLTNFSFPHKTIFKKPKNDSLYESILFAYIEQQIILNNISGIETIIKLIDSDTSEIYEWPHWNSNKKNIKSIIIGIKEKMNNGQNTDETLNYLYSLKEKKLGFGPEESVLTFQSYLDILMRYLIMTHIILKRDAYFASFEVFKKFFENTKIYSLQQGFSEIVLGFLPFIFSMNFKLFCWEKKDENNNNLILKKKYFITKDEKWKENPTICLIQNEDMLSYRFLPLKEHDQLFYKRAIEDFCLNYNDLLKNITKYYNDYVETGILHMKNEFDIFKSIQKKNDPFQLMFYENHNLENINGVFTKLKNLNFFYKVNPSFDNAINDFVFEKTTRIETSFKELHSYIQKINQYSTYKSDCSYVIQEKNKYDNFEKYDKLLNEKPKLFATNDKDINKYSYDNLNDYQYLKKDPILDKTDFYQPYIANIPNKLDFEHQKIYDDKKKMLDTHNLNTHPKEYKPFELQKHNEIPAMIIKQSMQICSQLKIQCPICSSDVSVDDNIITLDCEHRICKDCLTSWLMVKYDLGQWDLDNFKCFVPECNQMINIHILKHIIGDEKFSKMCDKLVEKLCMNCPYHDCKMIFMNELKNRQKITCPSCQRDICSKCNEKYHDTKACPKLFNIALKALKNEKLNVCPECFEVYLKDDKCAHVKCMKCNTEFCFECSCLRLPTMSHGNHYHRLDCKFFFEKVDQKTKKPARTDDYDPNNCKLCKESGKACKRPISYKEFFSKFIKEKN